MDAWQQHYISQSEVQSLGKHMLQRRQVCGLHFPDLRVLSGGRSRNWIHRQFGQSRPELQSIADLRWLSRFRLRVWDSSAFRGLILLVLSLLLEFLSPYFVIIVDFDGLGQPPLQAEDGERRLLIMIVRVFEVFFNSGGDANFTQSGPLAHLRDRKERILEVKQHCQERHWLTICYFYMWYWCHSLK